MWLSMLGAAYAYRSGAHFSLRAVVVRLPILIQQIVSVALALVLVGFFGALLAASIFFVVSAAGHVAPGLRISMAIPYSSTVTGSALMLYYSCVFAWREIATRGASSNQATGAE
jgi:TRAP-type C4-dicarboxylate transport system permease small subunit